MSQGFELFSISAEQSVIGALMLDADAMDHVGELRGRYRDHHQPDGCRVDRRGGATATRGCHPGMRRDGVDQVHLDAGLGQGGTDRSPHQSGTDHHRWCEGWFVHWPPFCTKERTYSSASVSSTESISSSNAS